MNRGTSNVEHRTSNERAKDRKRAPHPGPLPVWRGEGETATGRAAARPYPIRSSANRPYPVGRVTPPDIGCRGPCAPSGDALPVVRPTTFAAGRGLPALPGSWSQCMRKIERRLSMNLISERGSVTRSSLVCKATCCGSQSRAPFRRPGSWSQCMRKIERRLSMNHWTRRRPGCSADSLSAVSPTGSRQEIIFPASGPIADCQSAIQQTASLRYEGQVQGFNARILRGILSPFGGERENSESVIIHSCLWWPLMIRGRWLGCDVSVAAGRSAYDA